MIGSFLSFLFRYKIFNFTAKNYVTSFSLQPYVLSKASATICGYWHISPKYAFHDYGGVIFIHPLFFSKLEIDSA